MIAKKPLIFVHPLSDSLAKLKDVIEEIAEDEKIEIYELENQAEINQLLPTIGQSLAIFSNAKKCAMTLQPNRKVVSKLNSKVLLLSKKSLPRRTQDKFSKIGLTECIVEPVAPKTLLYKVKLLLRSIVVREQEEEEDYDKKFASDEEETNDTNSKQRLEKGILAEEEAAIDISLKENVTTGFDIEADDDEESKKSGHQEEVIEKEWKGSVNETSIAIDEEEKPEKEESDENENYIDSYLRGKRSQVDDVDFEEESMQKNKSSYEENYDDDIYKQNKSNELNLSADVNENNNDREESDLERDDKYYKGKVGETSLDLDVDSDDSYDFSEEMQEEINEARKKSEFHIDIDADEDEKGHLEDELDEDDIYAKKRKGTDEPLNLTTDEDQWENSEEEQLDEDNRENENNELGFDLQADEEGENQSKNNELSLEEEDKKRDSDEDAAEEIETHWKGEIAASIEIETEEEVDARSRTDEELDIENDNQNSIDEALGLDLAADDEDNHKEETSLEFDDEESKSNEDEGLNIEADEEINAHNKETNLEFENDVDDTSQDSEDVDDQQSREKEINGNLNLEFANEDEDIEKENDLDEDSDYKRRSTGTNLELDDDIERKTHGAHTEHIETNMDSRKGIKHQEYDWDIKHDKKYEHDDDFGNKKKNQVEISFKEKVDLGEQTIDYRKLQSEFDAITINRVGNKKKRTGPKYTADENSDEFRRGVYAGELEEGLEDISELEKNANIEQQKDQYFEPTPNGIDSAVRVLNLYQDKFMKKEQIFKFVANELRVQFKANTFIYTYSQEKNKFILSFDHTHEDFFPSNEIKDFWPSFAAENIEFWIEHNLPHWHDENFSTDKNQFYYPLTEGNIKFGFAICIFDKQVEMAQTRAIEVIIETVRGIVLSEYREQRVEGSYESKVETNEKKNSGGFFQKVFSLFKKAS